MTNRPKKRRAARKRSRATLKRKTQFNKEVSTGRLKGPKSVRKKRYTVQELLEMGYVPRTPNITTVKGGEDNG